MANDSIPKVTQAASADVDAPAQSLYAIDPPVVVDESGQSFYLVDHILPTNDARDGGNAPLSGLGNAYCATHPFSGGPESNPFNGLIGQQCRDLQGSIVNQIGVTPTQAGTTVQHKMLNTNVGGNMAFAIWTDDGPSGLPPVLFVKK